MTQPPPGDLLVRVTREALDDEYVARAASRGSGGDGSAEARRTRTLVTFGAAVAVLAVLLTVSAVETRAGASEAEADREALIARLTAEQDRVAGTQDRVLEVQQQVGLADDRSQALASAVDLLSEQVQDLRATSGAVPVSGPGVRVTVDDSPDGSDAGVVRDSDLQDLVNGLWLVGAEAVAVNGQRVTSLTAIRQGNQAITVNYRSVTPPYAVTAIGDPDTLPADLLNTDAGARLTQLSLSYGVVFLVESATALTLPGRALMVRAAEPEPLGSATAPGDGSTGAGEGDS